jgi:hypothetical protein
MRGDMLDSETRKGMNTIQNAGTGKKLDDGAMSHNDGSKELMSTKKIKVSTDLILQGNLICKTDKSTAWCSYCGHGNKDTRKHVHLLFRDRFWDTITGRDEARAREWYYE